MGRSGHLKKSGRAQIKERGNHSKDSVYRLLEFKYQLRVPKGGGAKM